MKLLKYLTISAIVIASLPASSFAEDGLVFSDVSTLVQDLQICKVVQEENIVLIDQHDVKDQLITNLASEVTATESQLSVCSKQVLSCEQAQDIYEVTITNLKTTIDTQNELCEERVDAAKPSFIRQIKNAVIYVAAGILIGALL